ncbi:hypothetical protein L1049_005640 [Liquidambar formosana]|uniref:Uncharacterized protein n=1 Tax=Liquidambar formosana TaxID=63359 RepID=A0AAP0RDZ7_LIQFO
MQKIRGEWMLVDKCLGLGLVNRFNVNEVYKCLIHWGTGTVNLELWSEERPVSKQSPLMISHEYEVNRDALKKVCKWRQILDFFPFVKTCKPIL